MSGEWRKVENTVSDGPGQNRTETSYVFGAEYDGTFVAAITKSQGYFEHLLERGQQDAQAQQDEDAESGRSLGSTSTTQSQSGQQSAPQGAQGGSTSGGA